jgi:hypothetical protein
LLLVPFAPPAAWIALQSERRLLPSFTWLNDDGNGDNKSNVVKGRALPPKNPDMKAANALISAIKQRLPNGFVMGTLEPASPDIDRQLLRESYSIYRQVLSQQLAESVPLSALDAREMRALMRSMDLAGWPVFLNWRPLKALGAWRLSNEMDRILYEDRHLDSDKNETISMEDAHELLSRRGIIY